MNVVTYLTKSGLFSGIALTELRALAGKCDLRFLEAGQVLVRAESPQHAVVFLAEGKLAVYRRNKQRGVALLLGVLDAPSIFGDAEWAAGMPWMVSARAETDACCVLIPNHAFGALVDRHVAFAARLYRDASVRHLLANHSAQTIALYDVETRLLRLVLDYAFRYGKRVGDSAVLQRPVSQVEMAAALGVTRKTIARALRLLEQRGVIARDRENGRWTVHHLAKLRDSLPRHLLGVSSRFGEQVQGVLSRWIDTICSEEDDA